MKKFLSAAQWVARSACISFSASVLFYSLIDMAFSGMEMRYSLIWQILLLCVVICILQYCFFTGQVIKKKSYTFRLLLFFPALLLIVSLFGCGFHWFPLENLSAWGSFLGICIALYLLITAGFEIGFRLTGKQYNDKLGRYQKEREKRP